MSWNSCWFKSTISKNFPSTKVARYRGDKFLISEYSLAGLTKKPNRFSSNKINAELNLPMVQAKDKKRANLHSLAVSMTKKEASPLNLSFLPEEFKSVNMVIH